MPPRWRHCIAPRGTAALSSYDGTVTGHEPTVLWRLSHAQRSRRVPAFSPARRRYLAFFVDHVMDRAENFDSMDIALFRAEDVKRTLIGEGWKEDA